MKSKNFVPSPKCVWGAGKIENCFRKKFIIEKAVKKAVLRIFCDTGYELFLNGRFVACVDEWSNMRDYDVTPFMVKGENIAAVRALNHAGHRGLTVELSISMKGGDTLSVVSNSGWRTIPEERWGWREADFNDDSWRNAIEIPNATIGAEQWKSRPGNDPSKIIPYLTCSQFFPGQIPKCAPGTPFYSLKRKDYSAPSGVLEIAGPEYQTNLDAFPKSVLRPVKIAETFDGNGSISGAKSLLGAGKNKPAKISAKELAGGPHIIIDFGGEIAGYLRMRISSEGFSHARLHYGETLDECLNLPPRTALLTKMITEDYEIAPGTREMESIVRQGFRFVKIEFSACENEVELSDVSVKTSSYPVNYLGWFSCSDSSLNEIWQAGRKTLHLCMQEYYLDGIKRDRFMWVGDTRLEALVNYYLFGDAELFKYCWRGAAASQYNDGGIPSAFGEGMSILWDYVAWWIIALQDYYLHTGDKKFIREMSCHTGQAAEWLISRSDPADGLISIPDEKGHGWFYTLNGMSGKDPEFNGFFKRAMLAAAEMAEITGEKSLRKKYRQQAARTELSLSKFTKPVYDVNTISNSLASFDLIEEMFREGRTEAAIEFIKARWMPMLDCGGTSFFECLPVEEINNFCEKKKWNKYMWGSHCHGWTAGPALSLQAEVAGIKPVTPGFAIFEVRPRLGGLEFVKAVVPSPHGLIAVSMCAKDGIFEEMLFVPEGCRAKVYLPKLKNKFKIFADGKEVKSSKYGPADHDYICLDIATPGRHSFRSE
ncbi:MAG: family 78 glycoside hydrolase catalytic domain [Victivallaceae bacterium]|jgi:hypothetical protein